MEDLQSVVAERDEEIRRKATEVLGLGLGLGEIRRKAREVCLEIGAQHGVQDWVGPPLVP